MIFMMQPGPVVDLRVTRKVQCEQALTWVSNPRSGCFDPSYLLYGKMHVPDEYRRTTSRDLAYSAVYNRLY